MIRMDGEFKQVGETVSLFIAVHKADDLISVSGMYSKGYCGVIVRCIKLAGGKGNFDGCTRILPEKIVQLCVHQEDIAFLDNGAFRCDPHSMECSVKSSFPGQYR